MTNIYLAIAHLHELLASGKLTDKRRAKYERRLRILSYIATKEIRDERQLR